MKKMGKLAAICALAGTIACGENNRHEEVREVSFPESYYSKKCIGQEWITRTHRIYTECGESEGNEFWLSIPHDQSEWSRFHNLMVTWLPDGVTEIYDFNTKELWTYRNDGITLSTFGGAEYDVRLK